MILIKELERYPRAMPLFKHVLMYNNPGAKTKGKLKYQGCSGEYTSTYVFNTLTKNRKFYITCFTFDLPFDITKFSVNPNYDMTVFNLRDALVFLKEKSSYSKPCEYPIGKKQEVVYEDLPSDIKDFVRIGVYDK